MPNEKDLMKQLEQLRAENEALKKRVPTGKISFKVSTKGAVSIYGLGRFPVTLYSSQVKRLVEVVPALVKFVEDNKSTLTVKAEVPVTEA